MTSPDRYNWAPPLRGLVLRQNPAVVPVDASSDQVDMSYAQGQFSTRKGFFVRRRMVTTNGLPARYGSLVRLSDGALFPYFVHGGKLYRDTGVHLAPAQVATGWSPSRCPEVVQIGHAILVNGVVSGGKTPQVWDGTTLFDAGIAAPLTACTGATAAAGTPVSGTVRQDFTKDIVVLVTYGSDTWAAESEPGPPLRFAPVTTKVQLNLTAIPVSPNSRVGYRNIWVSIDGGLTFFLGIKLSDNTTTTVSIQQWTSAETELTKPGGLYAVCSVPQGDVMEFHEGRLFVASGTTLYWSERGTPEVFHPLARLAFQDPVGITALRSHGGRLLVAGRSNLWSLSGSFDMDLAGAADYTGKHLSSGIGVVGRQAITTFGTIAYFLSDNGFYSQQGDEAPVAKTDEFIEPVIDKVNDGWVSEACVTYNPSSGEVLCAIPVRDAQNPGQNQRMIVYRPKGDTWGYWQGRFSWIGLAYDDGESLDLFATDYNGNVLRMDYGHGDGLQGNEAYGKTVAGSAQQVDEGIPLLSIASQHTLTLDTTNLPADGYLRGIMLTIVDHDKESATYGEVEVHKVLDNDQSSGTVIVEDPVIFTTTASRDLRVYLGGIAAMNETGRSDFGSPGSRKVLHQVEAEFNDPRRELST